MEKYHNLMEYLKKSGHFVDSEANLPTIFDYDKTRFSPKKIVGVMVYSMLSSKPRKNFYTDGRFIYYMKGECVNWGGEGLTATQKHDIIREDEVFKILDAHPSGYKNLYGAVASHIRISDFTPSFNGKGTNNSEYHKLLEIISKEVPNSLIRQDEKNRISMRIHRNYNHLCDLLSALKSDKLKISDRLEKTLAQYDYQKSA